MEIYEDSKELIEPKTEKQFSAGQSIPDEDTYALFAAKKKKDEDEEDDDSDEEGKDGFYEEEEEEGNENPFDIEPTDKDIVENDFPDDEDDLFEDDEGT